MNWKIKTANLFYPFFTGLRRFLYESGILKPDVFPFPIISAGSLSSGGAGKTPFSIYLSSLLKQKANLDVWHIVNPYRIKIRDVIVTDNFKSLKGISDEALLTLFHLQGKEVKVVVSNSKIKSLRAVRVKDRTIAVVDDAFHTPYFRKNLEVVIIDKTDFRDESLTEPANVMRLKFNSLTGDELIVLRGFNEIPQKIAENFSSENIFKLKTHHRFYNWNLQKINVDEIKGENCSILCGIAKPIRFKSDMENFFNIEGIISVGDHREFSKRVIAKLQKITGERDTFLLITMKDRMRLEIKNRDFKFRDKTIIAEIFVYVEEEERFFKKIMERVKG